MEIEKSKKPKLVIDTNAFIKCLNLDSLADKYDFITSESVLDEIRDKSAKDKFSKILFDIKIKMASKSSLKFITNFAKKTGDYSILSTTDLDLMAVAYTITEENKTSHLLRSEPPKPVNHYPTKNLKQANNENQEGSEIKLNEDKADIDIEISNQTNNSEIVKENVIIPKEIENKVNETSEVVDKQEKKAEHIVDIDASSNVDKQNKMEDESSDEESDWITPTNISSHIFKTTDKKDDLTTSLGVAFLSSDFAMQNVLIQLGVPLLTLDGLSIQRTKHWLLECGACLHLCRDTTKEFCPTCGNHTMTRVSYGVDTNGGLILYRKKNYQYKTRGLIYSIPKPKGGRANDDLVLREDEMELKKKKHGVKGHLKEKDRRFKQAEGDFENGFGFGKVWEGEDNIKYGWGKKNVNEPRRTKK